MDNDWKKRLGVVYSTNKEFEFEKQSSDEMDTLPAQHQRLTVFLDKKNRKGKSVTLVTGFVGTNEDLKSLGKMLKASCGVGGSVKDSEIILQGDHRELVLKLLLESGYKAKKSGG